MTEEDKRILLYKAKVRELRQRYASLMHMPPERHRWVTFAALYALVERGEVKSPEEIRRQIAALEGRSRGNGER